MPSINGCSLCSTQFAYQGIVGLGWNVDRNFRINLDGRYYGTTSPGAYQNNNITAMLGLTYKFGQPETVAAPAPAPAAVAPPSFMVFFDWDRSNLSAQALTTIKQAADAYKTKGNARVTATGHTDTSGPDAYNMALSLRRANTVKDALVRKACRPARSRSSAVASRACWFRPATTSASRRTAASRSLSSKLELNRKRRAA